MSTRAKLIIALLVGIFVSMVVAVVLVAAFVMRQSQPEDSEAVAKASAAPAEGEALARIQARGELRVLMDTGTPPWTGLPPMFQPNAAGEPDGFDYRLAARIAQDIGVEKVKILHSTYMDFSSRLTTDPEVDLVLSGFVPYNEPGLTWSEPYLEFGLCLIVAGDSKIETIDDLWGKRIAIFPDDAAEAEVKRLVKGYKSLQRIENGYFELILNGKLDALIYDYPFAAAEIAVHYSRFPQHNGKLRIAQYNLTDSTYNVAVRSADTDLLAAVNTSIAAWRQSPDYAQAVKDFLSGLDSIALPQEVQNDPNARTHAVAKGETLASIAVTVYGDGEKWKAIWEANKERLPNPNLVEVGDVLVLP
jgi:ABC-type amino acid transport substrate-binding protein